MSDIYNFDVIVVGAGVIGIAIAMTCAKKKKSVLLIEKNSSFGEEISSRNSEVIHAGIYYPKDSLKAKFCRDGMERLYKYCTKKNIPIKKTGKLIVQTNPKDQNKLLEILDTGKKNRRKYIKVYEFRLDLCAGFVTTMKISIAYVHFHRPKRTH